MCLFLVPSLGLFSLFGLPSSDVLAFVLFFYYSLETCLFTNERQKGREPDGREGRKDLGGVEEGETGNQDILCGCVGNLFSIKEKDVNKTKFLAITLMVKLK